MLLHPLVLRSLLLVAGVVLVGAMVRWPPLIGAVLVLVASVLDEAHFAEVRSYH